MVESQNKERNKQERSHRQWTTTNIWKKRKPRRKLSGPRKLNTTYKQGSKLILTLIYRKSQQAEVLSTGKSWSEAEDGKQEDWLKLVDYPSTHWQKAESLVCGLTVVRFLQTRGSQAYENMRERCCTQSRWVNENLHTVLSTQNSGCQVDFPLEAQNGPDTRPMDPDIWRTPVKQEHPYLITCVTSSQQSRRACPLSDQL